jgi:hypothetical protein
VDGLLRMEGWSSRSSTPGFCCASPHDRGTRLRHIAVSLGITGRGASGIVTGMTAASTPSSTKDGHHNRYQILWGSNTRMWL